LVTSCVGSGHVIQRKIEERIEVTGRRGKRRKLLLNDLKEKYDVGNLKRSTRSYYVENSLRKGRWACRKTGFGKNILLNECMNELLKYK
jgi:hypothetical protein